VELGSSQRGTVANNLEMARRLIADMTGRMCLVICETLNSGGNVVTNAGCFLSERTCLLDGESREARGTKVKA
jgi:hypothetical protein